MAYKIKTSISFGLVYIPVHLEPAVKQNEISFNQLDKKTGSRIRYIKTCEQCEGKEVAQGDIIRAYQYEKNRYVTFDESDFEKIKTARDKSIVIERFVPLSEIDAVYYDKPYSVLPAGADKAYALLKQAMLSENKVGIAKTVLGTKETLVALLVRGGQLCLSTLHFYSEIQQSHIEVKAELSNQELDLARSIIQNMSGDFNAENYKDEYTERVLAAIEQKIAGQEITAPNENNGKIIDLMEALKASLKDVTTGGADNLSEKTQKTANSKKKESDNTQKIVDTKKKESDNMQKTSESKKKEPDKSKKTESKPKKTAATTKNIALNLK